MKPDSPTIRILQLSDIHIDFEYQPGALAECGQPLCCRNSSTIKRGDVKSSSNETSSGYWGDYRNCGIYMIINFNESIRNFKQNNDLDVPLWTVENMFDHISKNEDVKDDKLTLFI